MNAGFHTLLVGAQKNNYFIPEISISVEVQRIPTELILPESVADVYWGEDVSIWAMFNDTRSNSLISGATVTYEFGNLGGTLSEVGPAGNYSFTVDSGDLALATTHIVSITASLLNYEPVVGQISVHVLRLPLSLTVVDGLQDQEVFKGTPINVTVYIHDLYNDVPLAGVTITTTALWTSNTVLSPTGVTGYYTGLVDTSNALVGSYGVVVKADRMNYLSVVTSISVEVDQIPTVLWLDALTSTYSNRTFDWSESVTIGVYVLAPSLNISYPYSTGISNCTVSWTLSGTVHSGLFLNGTSVGGPGYFYYQFDTSDFNATTYTMRITALPGPRSLGVSSNMTTLAVYSVQTKVESPYLAPKVWGWTGWVNFTYSDLLRNRSVDYADLQVIWEGRESQFTYLGSGVYSVFINTTLVTPGVHSVSVKFSKDNFEGGTGVLTLKVLEVPTAITVFTPATNQIDDNALDLRIPYGDTLPLTLFYNDTWYNQGLSDATYVSAVVLHRSIEGMDTITITELFDGNYSLPIDTTRWKVDNEPYEVVLSIQLDNRSKATVNLEFTIINLPTGLEIEGGDQLFLSYGQTVTVRVFYYDDWPTHERSGIVQGVINATSWNDIYVVVASNRSDFSEPGWYEIVLSSGRAEGSVIVTIELSKENCESAVVTLAVSVEPSELDILLERAIIYGFPLAAIAIIGAVLWSRLFSLPKLLRKLNGMVKTLKKGDIPDVPEGVRTRQQILIDLFNDLSGPVGISGTIESMPKESITLEVPEMEELLVQLSILTELTPEELDDFKADVSKMRLSEQVIFVKEVITQESIKRGRAEGKAMEQVWDETRAQARAKIRGEELVEKPPEPKAEPEPEPTPEEAPEKPLDELLDKLAEHEIEVLREKLRRAGLPEHEVQNIVEQAKELPRELVDDLIESILAKGGGE